MKIEDYWIDYTIYEVEYKENRNGEENFLYDFICCFTKIKQEQLEKVIKKKNSEQGLRIVNAELNEMFPAFLDKKIDSKIKLFTFYTIKFEVQIDNKTKVFERVILEDPKLPMEKLSNKIIKQFANVSNVIRIVKIGTALKII